MKLMSRSTVITALMIFTSTPAFAHLTGVPHDHSSFTSGFLHPLTGFDHILVMVAVGLWAAQLGGKSILAVPASFVVCMAIGFWLATKGIALPYVEPVILASVIAMGLFAAMAVHLPIMPAMLVVGAFAVFHGYAHGLELENSEAYAYGIGFSIATALLHGVGITIGLGAGKIFGRSNGATAIRIGGVATTLAGLYLAFAAA